MAWRWRATSDNFTEAGCTVKIDYIDDSDPASVILSHDFPFEPGTTKQEAVFAIRKFGRLTKFARDQAEQLSNAFAPGEEGIV